MIKKTKNTFFVSTTSTRKKKIFGPRSTNAPGAFRRLSFSHACGSCRTRQDRASGTTWDDGGRLGAARRETGEGAVWGGGRITELPRPPCANVGHVRAHPVPERRCVHLARGFPHLHMRAAVSDRDPTPAFPDRLSTKKISKRQKRRNKTRLLWSVAAPAQRFLCCGGLAPGSWNDCPIDFTAGCTPCCTAGCTSGCTSSCKLAVLRETVCGRFLAASLFFFVTREVTSIRTLSDETKEKKSHGAARVARANNSKIFIFLDSPQLLPCGELGSFLLGGGRRFFRTKMFLKSSIKFTSLHTFDSLSLCISFFCVCSGLEVK